MDDDELLKPSIEMAEYLRRLIKESEAETAEKANRHNDKEYEKELWHRHHQSTYPLRIELDFILRQIADYKSLRSTIPPMIVPRS